MYRCVKCGKIIEDIGEKVICPYCGYRILVKVRPNVVKRVRAR